VFPANFPACSGKAAIASVRASQPALAHGEEFLAAPGPQHITIMPEQRTQGFINCIAQACNRLLRRPVGAAQGFGDNPVDDPEAK
jgi:hypothetical protein